MQTRDRGSAVPLLVMTVALALTSLAAVALVLRVASARVQASAAADLAALAAAADGSCTTAAVVAAGNAATLRSCTELEQDVVVHVEVEVSAVGRIVRVGAHARAGPPREPGDG